VHRRLASIIALVATGWVILVIAAPRLPVVLAGILYAAGSLICHQIPERSFHLDAFQLPVCARCLGLYAGGAVGSLGAALTLGRSCAPWPLVRKDLLYAATVLAVLPTVATVVLEWIAGWPVSNTARATAGLPLGFVLAFAVVRIGTKDEERRMKNEVHYGECTPRRPIGPGQPPSTHI
jgi:uncharacterized membrane protein